MSFISILFIHFFADFVFQSRYMGRNKSKDLMVLFGHCAIYYFTFLVSGTLLLFLFGGEGSFSFDGADFKNWMFFCLINFSLHFITDFITSKVSSFCWKRRMIRSEAGDEKDVDYWEHNFWCIVGLDQLVHTVTLCLTFTHFFG